MKRFLFIAGLALVCIGQGFGPKIVKGPTPAVSSQGLFSGLVYRWVAKDLTNVDVSVWTNRLKGGSVLKTNSSNPVTFSTDHVVLSGAINILTADPLLPFDGKYTPTTNGGCAGVIFSENQSATTGEILVSTNALNLLDVLSDGNTVRWEAGTVAVIAKNVILDVLYNADGYVYTNGKSTTMRGAQSAALGFSGVSRIKGNIYEILFWTNGPLSSMAISNYHYYATNTYSYAP